MQKHIAVLGGGVWGVALAQKIALNGTPTIVWARKQSVVDKLNQGFLANGNPFKKSHRFSSNNNLKATLEKTQGVLLATSSDGFREVLEKITHPPQYFSWATKGLDKKTHTLLSDLVHKKLGNPGAFLTGPTFAVEVLENKPTALLVAGEDRQTHYWQQKLNSDNFRIYTNPDIITAQVGAAVKNVIAIAVGIADGMNYGANARAALITRGLNEITKMALYFGGKKETLYGLSGLGDVVLTGTDNASRNRSYGIQIGRGEPPPKHQLVEGVFAAKVIYQIAQKNNLDLPICKSVHRIVNGLDTPQQTVRKLLARKVKEE